MMRNVITIYGTRGVQMVEVDKSLSARSMYFKKRG